MRFIFLIDITIRELDFTLLLGNLMMWMQNIVKPRLEFQQKGLLVDYRLIVDSLLFQIHLFCEAWKVDYLIVTVE
jgi:hypothetical protein